MKRRDSDPKSDHIQHTRFYRIGKHWEKNDWTIIIINVHIILYITQLNVNHV